VVQQLILGIEPVLGRQPGRAVLELGSPEALVRRVILPVDPLAAIAKGVGECLDQRRIYTGIGVEGLFNVDDQGVPTLFRQGQGDQLLPVKHAAGEKVGLAGHLQHLLGQLQLIFGLGVAVLGELRLIVLPELLDHRCVRRRQGAELRIRPLGPELVDVVPLAGVPPPGEELQILPVIDVVPPGPHIADPHIGIPAQQLGGPALRHHRDHRGDTPLQTVVLNGLQGRILVPLRAGDRVVEDYLAVDLIADHQASGNLRPGRVERGLPHELGAHGILTQAELTGLVIPPEAGGLLLCHWFEL